MRDDVDAALREALRALGAERAERLACALERQEIRAVDLHDLRLGAAWSALAATTRSAAPQAAVSRERLLTRPDVPDSRADA